MFNITHQDITTTSYKLTTIIFPYTQPDPPNIIANLSSSCGCGRVYNDIDLSQVIIKYTPSPTPKHLLLAGHNSYTTTKTITVNLVTPSGNMEIVLLTFTARVN